MHSDNVIVLNGADRPSWGSFLRTSERSSMTAAATARVGFDSGVALDQLMESPYNAPENGIEFEGIVLF